MIYPLDSTIQRLNNWGLIRRFVSCSLSTTYEPPCKIAEWLPPASCPLLCSIFWINLLNAGLSLKFQVGRESNSKEFLLALFFFYFPIKVARDHTHSSRRKSLAPGSLMTALKCFSKLVKVVRSVFKLVGFKLHALLVQPKHRITDYSRLPLKSYEPLLLLVYILASGGALGFKSQG